MDGLRSEGETNLLRFKMKSGWLPVFLLIAAWVAPARGQEKTPFRPPDVQIIKEGRETVIILSGVGPLGDKGQLVAPGDLAGQLRQTLENVRRLAAGAGSLPRDIVSMTVYTNEKQGPEIFAKLQQDTFKDWNPETSFVETKQLRTAGALVEINAVAVVSEPRARR
jgi:enamine deaminase RidA (YjgF/YER057c/UK114 family)